MSWKRADIAFISVMFGLVLVIAAAVLSLIKFF